MMEYEDKLAYAIYAAATPTLTGNENTGMAFLVFGFFTSIAVSMLYGGGK